MAKALIGYMNSDLRTPPASPPRTLGCARAWASWRRSSLRLSEENDRSGRPGRRLSPCSTSSPTMQEMQPV